MDLTEKRKLENKEQKDKRKELVITAAIEVFIEKGIENTKMTDIAEQAQVGVASVYRYFKAKTELVIAAAIDFWNLEIDIFYELLSKNNFKDLNGLMRVSELLDVFIQIYTNHKEFLRFIEEFDNYMIRKNISSERLSLYEKNILNLMPIMTEAFELGKKDGSIKQNINNEQYYVTITHTLMSLSQKLILRNSIISSDNNFDGVTQLELIKDMALKYIANENFRDMNLKEIF